MTNAELDAKIYANDFCLTVKRTDDSWENTAHGINLVMADRLWDTALELFEGTEHPYTLTITRNGKDFRTKTINN